mmetsp:Transcript_18624/g.40152  ORF Transcript_18624/g.40152 Transcript_18624/m.40152 type:complete len:287 (+) Transcript_18624:395-1255(+)
MQRRHALLQDLVHSPARAYAPLGDGRQVGRADDALRATRVLVLDAAKLFDVARLGGERVEARILEVGSEGRGELVVEPRALDGTLRLRAGGCLSGALDGVGLAADTDVVAVVPLPEDSVGGDLVVVGVVECLHLDIEQQLVLVLRQVAKRKGRAAGREAPLALHRHAQRPGLEDDVHVVEDERWLRLADVHGAVALLVDEAAGLRRGVELNVHDLAVGRAHDPVGGGHLGAVHEPLGPVKVGLLDEHVERDVQGGEEVEDRLVRTAEVSAPAVRKVEVRVLPCGHR